MSDHYDHSLRLIHRRRTMVQRMGQIPPADSTVEVEAESTDLTEAWAEILSRVPNDVYAAIKAAMAGIDR